jgi:hypothetical protein
MSGVAGARVAKVIVAEGAEAGGDEGGRDA